MIFLKRKLSKKFSQEYKELFYDVDGRKALVTLCKTGNIFSTIDCEKPDRFYYDYGRRLVPEYILGKMDLTIQDIYLDHIKEKTWYRHSVKVNSTIPDNNLGYLSKTPNGGIVFKDLLSFCYDKQKHKTSIADFLIEEGKRSYGNWLVSMLNK